MHASPLSDAAIRALAEDFVDAFNRRDRKAWIALFAPEAELRPTVLSGSRSLYAGHERIGAYIEQLVRDGIDHQARVRELRRMGDDRFALFTDVLVEGEVVSPGAVLIRLDAGRIVQATAYLSDDETLAALDLVPRPGESRALVRRDTRPA